MTRTTSKTQWKVGNNGTGKHIWFIWRDVTTTEGDKKHSHMEILSDKRGRFRRFATYDTTTQALARQEKQEAKG